MNTTWTRSREYKEKKAHLKQPKQKGHENSNTPNFSSKKSVTSASWQEAHVRVFGQSLCGWQQGWLPPGEGSNTQAPRTRPHSKSRCKREIKWGQALKQNQGKRFCFFIFLDGSGLIPILLFLPPELSAHPGQPKVTCAGDSSDGSGGDRRTPPGQAPWCSP